MFTPVERWKSSCLTSGSWFWTLRFWSLRGEVTYHICLPWGASGARSGISCLDDGHDQCPQFLFRLSTYPASWPVQFRKRLGMLATCLSLGILLWREYTLPVRVLIRCGSRGWV